MPALLLCAPENRQATMPMTFLSNLLEPGLVPYLLPIVLLICSNVFMTFAWYGHLKYKSVPLITVVLISRAIASPKPPQD